MNKYIKLLLVPLFLFVFYAFAQANTYAANKIWIGSGAINTLQWSNPANWSGNSLPTSVDDVFFNANNPNSNLSYLDGTFTVKSITFNDSGNIIPTSGSISTDTINVNVSSTSNKAIIGARLISSNMAINVNQGILKLDNNVIGVNTSTPFSLAVSTSNGTLLEDYSTFIGNSISSVTKSGQGTWEVNRDKRANFNNTGGNVALGGGITKCFIDGCLGNGKVTLGRLIGSTGDITLDMTRYNGPTGGAIVEEAFSNNIVINTNGANKNIIKYTLFDGDINTLNMTFNGSISADNNGDVKVYLENSTPYKLTFAGQLLDFNANKLSVEKIGTGKVVYTNASNTYTGSTTITDGVLQIHGSQTKGTAITNSADGSLVLSNNAQIGTFNSASIYSGAKGVPGTYNNTIDSHLTLTKSYGVRFLTLNTGDYSHLTVNGKVNLTNADLVDWSESNLSISPTLNQSFTILNYTGTRTGTFKNAPNNSLFKVGGQYFFKVVYDDNAKTVNLVKVDVSTVAVHRFENKTNGYHHFTVDTGEIDFLKNSAYGQANWNYEGSKFQAFSTQVGNTLPVFRFFNFKNGQHFLTTDVGEKDFLQNSAYGQQNWQYEDIAFYMNTTLEGQMSPVSRFAHKVNGEHFYTIDAGEANFLRTSPYGQSTWADEGTSMYTFQ